MKDKDIDKLVKKLERQYKETGSESAKRLADSVKLHKKIKKAQ